MVQNNTRGFSMASSLPSRSLGKQGLQCSAQGLGCMSLSKGMYHDESSLGSEQDRIAVIRQALSAGETLLNTADLYGPFDNHKLIGKAIKGIPRDQVVIANKFGPMTSDHGGITQNSSPDYCRQSLNTALGNLGLDYIDLYIMRGWDHETPIEESVKTMAAMVSEGLVKGIGLSEISAADIRKAHAIHPITAVELEWSLFTRDAERDLVPTCRELGIGIIAYGPMSRGLLTGRVSLESMGPTDFRRYASPQFSAESMKTNKVLVDKLTKLAKKKGCKPGQLALAWVHHQGDDVFPTPGTKNLKYLEENIAAFDIKLSKQEMAELENAVPYDAVAGERYANMAHATYHYDQTT